MSYVFNPLTGQFDIAGAGSATTPGGSYTQVQFNDGGSFAGATGVTFDKSLSELTLSGVQFSLSGNFSAASWGLNGLKLKGGTSTLTDTSAAGTVAAGATNVLGGNTIAATNARTITDYFSTYIIGPVAGTNVTLTNRWALGLAAPMQVAAGTFTAAQSALDISQTWNASGVAFEGLKISIIDTASSSGSALISLVRGTSTAKLNVDAANTLAQRNGTSAQTFHLYNTFTDASNYERGVLKWDTNVLKLGAEAAGSGTTRAVEFVAGGASRLTVNANGTIAIPGALAGSGELRAGAASSIYFNNRSRFLSPSDSVVTLINNAQTDFDRLQFGGTTSSFPAIKRTGTVLQARLADDSAFTTVETSGVNAYATYTSGTNYQRCGIKTAKTTLSNVSGASVTATSLIPAGAFLIGITSRVNTALGTGNGTTGYQVGTASDPDLWGAITGTTAGTASGSANYTAEGASGLFTAATNVIVTAVGGNFDATGVIELCIHYLLTEAD